MLLRRMGFDSSTELIFVHWLYHYCVSVCCIFCAAAVQGWIESWAGSSVLQQVQQRLRRGYRGTLQLKFIFSTTFRRSLLDFGRCDRHKLFFLDFKFVHVRKSQKTIFEILVMIWCHVWSTGRLGEWFDHWQAEHRMSSQGRFFWHFVASKSISTDIRCLARLVWLFFRRSSISTSDTTVTTNLCAWQRNHRAQWHIFRQRFWRRHVCVLIFGFSSADTQWKRSRHGSQFLEKCVQKIMFCIFAHVKFDRRHCVWALCGCIQSLAVKAIVTSDGWHLCIAVDEV